MPAIREETEVESRNTHNDDDDDATDAIVEMNQVVGNVLFLIGSVLYLWLAIWDIHSMFVVGNNNNDDDDDDDDEFSNWDRVWDVISIAAPSSFVFNALIDFWYSAGSVWDNAVSSTFGMAAFCDLMPSVLYLIQGDESKWAKKEQTIIYMAAVHLYLVNAILAIIGKRKEKHQYENVVVIEEENHSVDDDEIIDYRGVDTTTEPLSSAPNDQHRIIGSQVPHSSFWAQRRSFLVWQGDWLFLIGSMIDVCISYIPPDDGEVEEKQWKQIWESVEVWGVISATLWLIDAILYLVADTISLCRYDFVPPLENGESSEIENNRCREPPPDLAWQLLPEPPENGIDPIA